MSLLVNVPIGVGGHRIARGRHPRRGQAGAPVAVLVAVDGRAAEPLLPRRVFAGRARVGAFLSLNWCGAT